jgi:hypothetical protein
MQNLYAPNSVWYVVRKLGDAEYTNQDLEVNFYDANFPMALPYARECKRDMKAMTGDEYEVVVKTINPAEGDYIFHALEDWLLNLAKG